MFTHKTRFNSLFARQRPFRASSVRSEAKETGFSLVELMITVVIIGILVAIAVPVYNNQIREAKIATVKSDLHMTVANFLQFKKARDLPDSYQPTAAEFASIQVKSDPATTFTQSSNGAGDDENRDLCFTVSYKFSASDTVKWSYNMLSGDYREGACKFAAPLEKETPS